AGMFTISLGRFVKWLGGLVEGKGVYLFLGTCAVEVLYDDKGAVCGVRTGDKGLATGGGRKGNFEPGTLLRAKVTVFAEGPRGTMTEDLIGKKGLRQGRAPQLYSLGCKEVIRTPTPPAAPAGAPAEGKDFGGIVLHTMGYPLRAEAFGG